MVIDFAQVPSIMFLFSSLLPMIQSFLIRLPVLIGMILMGCVTTETRQDPTAPTAEESSLPSPYEEFEADRGRLRKTVRLESTGRQASSPEAVQAAHRFFAHVSFAGKKRDEVLKILGDPQTISDYGVPMEDDPNSPLIYRFDTGSGGVDYAVFFKRNRAVKIISKAFE